MPLTATIQLLMLKCSFHVSGLSEFAVTVCKSQRKKHLSNCAWVLNSSIAMLYSNIPPFLMISSDFILFYFVISITFNPFQIALQMDPYSSLKEGTKGDASQIIDC